MSPEQKGLLGARSASALYTVYSSDQGCLVAAGDGRYKGVFFARDALETIILALSNPHNVYQIPYFLDMADKTLDKAASLQGQKFELSVDSLDHIYWIGQHQR